MLGITETEMGREIEMDEDTGRAVLDRWSEDPGFRSELRADPVTAITGIGVELTAEDREFLEAVDWSLSDEELEALLEKKLYC
jgi:hypothetical protein